MAAGACVLREVVFFAQEMSQAEAKGCWCFYVHMLLMHTRKMSRYDTIAGEHENADTQEGDERAQGNHDVSGARANRYFDS